MKHKMFTANLLNMSYYFSILKHELSVINYNKITFIADILPQFCMLWVKIAQ